MYLINGIETEIESFDIATITVNGRTKQLYPRQVIVVTNSTFVAFRIEGKEYIEITLPIEYLEKLWDTLQSYYYHIFGDACSVIEVKPDNRVIEDEFNNLITPDSRRKQKEQQEWN